MWTRVGVGLALAFVACSGALKTSSPPPQPPSAATSSRSAPGPRTPPPPLEGRDGVAGQPRDDTAFEYELETATPNDEPPLLDGVAATSDDIKRTLGAYLDARRARLVGAASSGGLLVLTRLGETTHAHRVAQPLGQREQVTFGPEPVEQASYVPTQPNLVTYRVDTSGNEDYQVLMVDLETRRLSLLSDGQTRHGPYRWSSKAQHLALAALSGESDTHLLLRSGHDSAPRTLANKSGQWVIKQRRTQFSQAQQPRQVLPGHGYFLCRAPAGQPHAGNGNGGHQRHTLRRGTRGGGGGRCRVGSVSQRWN